MTRRTVVAGKIHSVNPGKRQVRIRATARDIPDEAFLGRLRLRLTDDREVRPLVATLRRPGGAIVVELTPGTPRDSVAAMRGAEVLWETGEADVALLGRLDVEALVGMRLVGPRDTDMGEVVGALKTPAHGVIEVKCPDGRSLLLPVIRETVERINWEAGVIFVKDIAPFAVDDAH
ncbi:MAG: hypothetical protein U9Q79_08730 [Candidatus Hydrogenedentes bacterium]|nr:hypothetical protein [Candidatus Hydrogenedentota bacterium]